MSNSTLVKICCIANREEAALAIACGASALGLVSAMPSGPGVIDESAIAEIVATVPPSVASFLLTSRQEAKDIISQQKHTGVNTLQLCDVVSFDALSEIRAALPGITLVQVVHVVGPASIDEAVAVAPFVDAILLDSGNPTLAIKELGGTGRQHDWTISRQIREAVGIPVWLAGGLNVDNVREAIETVAPFGLDICSGVRTNGQLDEVKLRAFISVVTGALIWRSQITQ